MEPLKRLLLAMDPDFPELESRATALIDAGYGTESRLKAARLEALSRIPGLLAGDAELIWNFHHPNAGDIPFPNSIMHQIYEASEQSQCRLSALPVA